MMSRVQEICNNKIYDIVKMIIPVGLTIKDECEWKS